MFFFLGLFGRGGGVGWGGVFSLFPMCSHYVPIKFPRCCIRFSKFSSSSQCVPQHIPNSNSFSIPNSLAMVQGSCI